MTCYYRCLKCGLLFEREKPGPTQCDCGHLYLDWLNAKEFIGKEEEK